MPTSDIAEVPEGGGGVVQSVERALRILESLSRSEGELGVSEIGAATGMPVGTVHRLLTTLVSHGYVRQNPHTRKYALGLRLLGIAAAARERIGAAARPFLTRLMQVSGETANLAILEQDSTTYVEQVPPPRMLRIFTEPGNRVALHTAGTGKVLLAYQPPQITEEIVRRSGLPRMTAYTITEPARLQAELERVRRQGYAIDFGEQEEGVRCLAAPVFVPNGDLLAAMSISGPSGRLSEARLNELIPHIKKIAAALSGTLKPGA